MTTETYYTVVWDYVGGDCGDLPWRFDTEEAAEQCGADWVADVLADMDPTERTEVEESGEGMPVYHVIRHPKEA